tara:strand:- start:4423 stop:4671 length:249 start_codon:yes stop_codon:yes gene_type:complete
MSDFDIPHDQLARNKQLEEAQQIADLKKAVKRGLLVYDSKAELGVFAKRLISLMKTALTKPEIVEPEWEILKKLAEDDPGCK